MARTYFYLIRWVSGVREGKEENPTTGDEGDYLSISESNFTLKKRFKGSSPRGKRKEGEQPRMLHMRNPHQPEPI